MRYYKYDPITNEFSLTTEPNNSAINQLMWHVTNKCYLKCPYCFSPKNALETPFDKVLEYIALISDLGIQKVDISGGEPLTYKFIEEVCVNLIIRGIAITLTSSGVGEKKLTDWLIGNADMFNRVIISIDSIIEKRHDIVRGQKGAFNAALELIAKLHKKNFSRIRINSVVTSMFDYKSSDKNLLDMLDIVRPLEWCLIQPHPAYMPSHLNESLLTTSDFLSKVSAIRKLSKNSPSRIIHRTASNFSTYWVLHPHGILSQRSKGLNPKFTSIFDKEQITTIKQAALNKPAWLPLHIAKEKRKNGKRTRMQIIKSF